MEINSHFLSNLARNCGPLEPTAAEGDPDEYATKPTFIVGDETSSVRVGCTSGMAEVGIAEGTDEEPGEGNARKWISFMLPSQDTLGTFIIFVSKIAVDTGTKLKEEFLETSKPVSANCVVLMSDTSSDLPFAIRVKLEESFTESSLSSSSSRPLNFF